MDAVSDAASHDFDGTHGASLLQSDLTDEGFASLPVLKSLEQLEIDDLTDDEYQKFVSEIS